MFTPSDTVRRCAAEFIGTFGLVVVATGAIMADALSGGQVTLVGIGLATGMILAVVVYVFGPVSGAHVNPAVTIAFAAGGKLPWRAAPLYIGAQLLGAALASWVLLMLLGNVAGMGGTMPAVGPAQGLGLEVMLTFFLMLVVTGAAASPRSQAPLAAAAIGATIALEIIFAGSLTGASMNPARSLAPALVASEWAHQWIYVAGPVAGAALAPPLYRWLRAAQQPDE